jgi:hypothetical protein
MEVRVDIVTGFSFSKELFTFGRMIAELLHSIPPSVGASMNYYPGNEALSHLRLINVGAATIHGFRVWVKLDESNEWQAIEKVYRIATDIYGNRVKYGIKVSDEGIYIRPASPLFVPLDELPSSISAHLPESRENLQLKISYKEADGKSSKDKNLGTVVVVEAKKLTKNHD